MKNKDVGLIRTAKSRMFYSESGREKRLAQVILQSQLLNESQLFDSEHV